MIQKSLTTNLKFLEKFLFLIIIIESFLLGLYVGKNNQLTAHNTEVSKINTRFENEKLNYKKQVEQLNREIYALKNNLGIIIDFKKEKYKREAIGIYSPLLEGKQVELTTYKYKDATIIGKFIEINSFSNIGIWEFQTNTPLLDNDPPEDFVIFGGYENYLNQATSIEDIKKNWKESYKTKNGITMFYGYNYVPKYIGAVTLNSYHNYFHYRNPKPSLLIISYQTVGIPLSAADPAVSKAKEELNKIVDTLELVQPN